MKTIKRWVGASVAAAILFASTAVRAQVMQQIPPDALVVIKINNLKGTSDKLAKLSQDLGLAAMAPEMTDPLGALQNKAQMKQGLDTAGEFAIAMVDPAPRGNDVEKSILVYVPVSDFKAFLGNWPGAKTDGDISEVTFPGDPSPEFLVNWGKYAVFSPSKDLVTRKPSSGLTATAVSAKELSSKDAVLFANFTGLRSKLQPHLQQARAMIAQQMDRAMAGMPQGAKFTPLARVAVAQMLAVAEGFVNEAQAGTVGMSFSADGFSTSAVTDFSSGGYVAQNITSIKNTDASLLAGLPNGKYLIYGGGASDPQKNLKIISDLLDPIMKEVVAIGPEMAPVQDYVNAIKAQLGATTGQTFGLIAPTGALGTEAIIQMIAVQRGNAKAIADSYPKLTDAEQKLLKMLSLPNAEAMTPTHIANAKMVDGVSFNSVTVKMDANPQNAQAMQQRQALAIVYGPNGPTFNYGIVGDKVLMVSGVSDQAVKDAIASVKSNATPLEASDGYKEVAAQLPKQRVGVVFVNVAEIATTTLNYMKQFGFAVPVQLPPGLPPVGAATSFEGGTAARVDVYIPKSLVQSLVAAGMQAQMQMQGGGGPRGGGL